jgi:hypothetical protein
MPWRWYPPLPVPISTWMPTSKRPRWGVKRRKRDQRLPVWPSTSRDDYLVAVRYLLGVGWVYSQCTLYIYLQLLTYIEVHETRN